MYDIVENCESPQLMGYSVKDINKDGIAELVLLQKDCRLHGLFTLVDNEPVLLLRFGENSLIDEDGTVYQTESEYMVSSHKLSKKIVDGKLEGLECGTDVLSEDGTRREYYKIENGERIVITEEEYDGLDPKGEEYSVRGYRYFTKNAGFRFIPAFEDSEQSDAPVADFSSYDSILSMYKNMVSVYSDCHESKWIDGEYDNMFSFPDNASYEMFNRIFYSGYLFRPTMYYYGGAYAENGDNAYGYAKKDLNSDGTEELILMTDSFYIIAIFTMKDGKAVLLDTYLPRRSCWIDENGLIRVHAWVGPGDRDSEYYLYNVADGALECQFGIGCIYNIYLKPDNCYKIEEGEKIFISDDEWDELYSQYDISPYNVSEVEYTKNFADLEFVPLFDPLKLDETYRGKTYRISPLSYDGVTVGVDGEEFSFHMDYFKYDESTGEVIYKTIIYADLEPVGDHYEFRNDTVSGKFELGVVNVWVTITESKDENIDCRTYSFEYTAEEE